MKKNVGDKDATLRIVLSILFVLLAILIVDNYVGKIILALVAAILAGTAFMHTCLIYKLMGKNTCENELPDVPEENIATESSETEAGQQQ